MAPQPAIVQPMQILRLGLQILSWIAPPLALNWIMQIWLSARRYSPPQREQDWLIDARMQSFPHAGGSVAYYRWGPDTRPYVLLVHGWSGRGSQLGGFAAALQALGLSVVSIDLPAHGNSSGKQTDGFVMGDALHSLIQQIGAPEVIIAHSFGGIISAYSVRAFAIPVKAMVIISTPTTVEYLLNDFAQKLGLRRRIRDAFKRKLEQRFGADIMQRFEPESNIRALALPTLIVHDKTDREVNWQEGERLAQTHSRTQCLLTDGLGHRRLLRDETVVAHVAQFIQSQLHLKSAD